jgi:hypothetical protein
MKLDILLQTRLQQAFTALGKEKSYRSFPPPQSLSSRLTAINKHKAETVSVTTSENLLFATGAVEMWHRAIHSFLISTSLTDVSPIWSSVAGYYSSHYNIRAIAHALGYFQLFTSKNVVKCALEKGKLVCTYTRKDGRDREHKLYWKIVKTDPHFNADPFFTLNDDGQDKSDVSHRSCANYSDHLSQFPAFRPLNEQNIKDRIDFISKIEITDPPIPKRSRFPDVDSVQIVAYHRLVRFRRFIDEVIAGKNKFWDLHREPPWAKGYLTYQVTPSSALGILS